MSKARTGEKNPMWQRHLSEATKKKISKTLTGHKTSESTRKNS